jgi:hypothetical protein
MNKITTGSYKDVKSIVLENDYLRVTLLPDWGSKIVSIRYSNTEQELLWQNPGKEYIKTGYGELFEKGEFSGFDDMFPTISRCSHEGGPWNGIELPDHGEVWSIPWEYGLGGDLVRLWVYGIRFPYRLEKRVYLEGRRLFMKYRVQNLSTFDLDFIWAAHPLFNTTEGMELIVPSGMNRIVNSVSGPRLGNYGSVYDFPSANLEDGTQFDLGTVPKQNDRGYQKYFFHGKLSEGWCVLFDPVQKLNIGMAFPAEQVPYEGGYMGQYNIAPEPATGGMDRIDCAKLWGMNSVLGVRETREWHLIISVEEGEKARGVGENGEIIH